VTTISPTTTWSPPKASKTKSRTTRATTTSTTTEPGARFAFALGANLGDARGTIERALTRLAARFGPLTIAPLYRTAPVSPIPQPEFLNTVAVGRTNEPPESLLVFARDLERELGRVERHRDAPREIDIDLLLVGSEQRASPTLVLPHPRLRERRFVLAPLADVAPDLPLPPDGATPARLLASLPPGPAVERLDSGTGTD
jgi:2-amino-4-hydroxy-6-hydroxymethyldihydropteridine diphosphokinase